MAASANSAVSNHSPRSSGDGTALNSPQAKQSAAGRCVLSPWMQVVRGSESDSIVDAAPSSPLSPSKASAGASSSSAFSADDSAVDAQMESTDNGSSSNNAGKKPVWNKPSSGAVEAGAVMGAVCWPALSESARASPKSSSSDSLKVVSDGLVSLSQGTGIASSTSQKQVITSNTSASLSPNHITPTRQKSMKRHGGSSTGSVTANGGFSQPPPPPLGSGVEMSSNAGRPGSSVVDSPSKELTHKESGQRGGFVSPGGNEHPPQRNSFRRGSGGSHPRGDGSYHHNHGGRRDHDRGNHDWNPHRSFSGRDSQMQSPRGVPRGFVRPPPLNSAFAPPPPPPMHLRPFGGPVVYPEAAAPPPVIYVPAPAPPPESLRGVTGVPIVAPISPHAMFFFPDPQLHSKIVSQIDYYFSNDNLIKDTFLRLNMDEQGWVPIKLIAGFKKVMLLTDNIQLILDVLHSSTIVEVQGDKVRRRNDWSRWIMPTSVQFPTISSPQSGGRSTPDMLTTSMQNLVLDENINRGQGEAFLSRSLSGDLNSQPLLSSSATAQGTGGPAAQAKIPSGSEYASARSN